MASKWLEERWEVLLPQLAQLGLGQEEQIQRLCEAELDIWRTLPNLRRASSLGKPLTQTRNRIRETLPVTNETGWINPKSGEREHLALKYLNFSTEEWVQMTLPQASVLRERLAHPLLLAKPSAVLAKAEQLVQMERWPELVVGLGLLTGRGLAEVVQTGHFTEKSAYTVWFAGPMTVYEQMCEPFEVPTLVRADLVLEALHRLRQFFGRHFLGVARREISRECTDLVREAVYRHLLGVVPLRAGERNVYRQLAHGVYPRLATWWYCPSWVDEIEYMAMIQQHRKLLEVSEESERERFAIAAGYRDYVLLDETTGEVEQRRGVKLGEPGVEVLAAFHEPPSAQRDSPDPAQAGDQAAGCPDGAETTPCASPEREETILLAQVLACMMYEVQVNIIENDPPTEILQTLAAVMESAPPRVMELVDRLRHRPPKDRQSAYPTVLPSFEGEDAEPSQGPDPLRSGNCGEDW